MVFYFLYLYFFFKSIIAFLLKFIKQTFFHNLKIKMVNLLYKKYLNEEYLFHVHINSSA